MVTKSMPKAHFGDDPVDEMFFKAVADDLRAIAMEEELAILGPMPPEALPVAIRETRVAPPRRSLLPSYGGAVAFLMAATFIAAPAYFMLGKDDDRSVQKETLLSAASPTQDADRKSASLAGDLTKQVEPTVSAPATTTAPRPTRKVRAVPTPARPATEAAIKPQPQAIVVPMPPQVAALAAPPDIKAMFPNDRVTAAIAPAPPEESVETVALPQEAPVPVAKPAIVQTSEPVIVINHAADGVKRAKLIAKQFANRGVKNVELRKVRTTTRRDEFRYFYEGDLQQTKQLSSKAKALSGFAIRDFTHYEERPGEGTLEIWISAQQTMKRKNRTTASLNVFPAPPAPVRLQCVRPGELRTIDNSGLPRCQVSRVRFAASDNSQQR